MKYHYYKIRKEREEWLGRKFFRIADDSDSVVQICFVPGELKRGRPNSPGIYFITRQSFASNIFQYVTIGTKHEFDKHFSKMVSMLK